MYAKVFTQIYDGTLCTNGPWEALVTFQQLLVLADQDGTVDMTAGAIARRTTIPLAIIEKGLAALVLPDAESRTPTEEGRRIVLLEEGRPWGWRVVNYCHYRAIKREEERRQYHREYWHAKRSKTAKAQPELNDSTETQHAQPNQPIAYTEAYAEEKKKNTIRTKKSRQEDGVSPKPALNAMDLEAEGVDRQTAADWLTLRKAKRVPLTATAWADTKAEGAKRGMNPGQTVKRAVSNGWAGFKASWPDPADGGRNGSPSQSDVFAGAL